MRLKDFLFGQLKIIVDPKIGNLEARIKNINPSINYTWTSTKQLPGQLEATVIILEGNANGPYKNQLTAAYSIVDNLTSIQYSIDKELTKTNLSKLSNPEDWRGKFYLAAITPIEVNDNSFELCFESINQDNEDYFACTWEDEKLIDFEFKVK